MRHDDPFAMALRTAFRGRIITSREGLWKGPPFKQLTEGAPKSGGRNSTGTCVHFVARDWLHTFSVIDPACSREPSG